MKNLFSKSFSRRRLTIAISSLIVFIAVTGTMFYHGTKKTVAISIDGQEKIVKTHANTISDILKDLEIKVSAEDYLYPSGKTEVKDQLQVVWKPAKQITLIQNGKEKKIWTTAETVGELLKESKLEVKKEDQITPSLDTELQGNMKVAFEKSFLLHVVDGTKKVNQVWSTSTTVADFLKHQGIVLNELDRVEPGLKDYVQANSTVKIVRVEKVTDVVEEPINFAVISKKDSSLSKGKEKVVTEGKKGVKSKQFEVIKENGKEIKRTLLSEKILKEKQDQVVAVGTKVLVAQVSRGTSENTSDGRELYVNSTAYTAHCNGCSGVTATGYNLKSNPSAKVIAVDPSVIPLGTKVYVEGYGYAIAADTGSAIRGNKIDVFFSSKSQAYKWGVRKVKIRILN
ncbi:G5 and 3D domain-containing protein [Peribacillus acanthi]|uniref:G5 and 3D domain-containing protein n=1 Tax=Peribacillus acanthi TaxID=2171554 RepID=UPI000D3E97C2|nr:G5 and 3D domain-containing protein [Peribacillus acanthi]